jgi:hypothetical protein
VGDVGVFDAISLVPGTGGNPAPTVTVSPTTATLTTGGTQTFTATVQNGSGTVNWSVNGVAGGNATVGTITSAGVYTAPASVPAGGSVTVTATLQGTSTSGSATVTINAAGGGGGGGGGGGVPAGNILPNPSFETNISGWGAWQASLTRLAAADAPDGGFAASAQATVAGASYTVQSNQLTIPAGGGGATYTATGWARAGNASATGKPFYIKIRERTSAGGLVREWTSNAPPLSATFQSVSVTATVVNAGDLLDVRMGQSGTAVGDVGVFDAISLVKS